MVARVVMLLAAGELSVGLKMESGSDVRAGELELVIYLSRKLLLSYCQTRQRL